jgi:CO/xanthine dehydrogenase Mo-binding subunit
VSGEWTVRARSDNGPSDLVAKVTGTARYVTDVDYPDLAHAVLVRSQVPHGLIRGIDTSAAEAADGVICVLTAADLDDIDPYYGELVFDQPAIAIDRVRYAGEPYCAVVAETKEAALEAAVLISADIEPLPGLFTPDDALAPDAAPIHPERAPQPDAHPNVCRQYRLDVGDVDAAFARAAYVHDAVYRCPAIYHYAMEAHCSIAAWEGGTLEVITGTQQPFRVRDGLARMFGLPQSRVHVQVPYVGGAYGSKGEMKYEPLVAALARKAGRPVKLACSIEESFHTVTRHAAVVRIRTAVDEDGWMIGRDSEIVFDTGAYADKGPRIASRGANRVSGPYKIPNLRARSAAVYTNAVPAGAFRGFSTSQVLWAEESAMDEIAHALGEDAVDFRMRHLLDTGDQYMTTDSPLDADLKSGLRIAADAIDMAADTPAFVGKGLAVGVKDAGGGAGQASATVRLQLDGSIEVFAGATELGQGAERVLGAIAANAFGVSADRVTVRLGDTANSPFDRGTNASRTTVGVGSAVADACASLSAQLREALSARGADDADFTLVGADLVTSSARVSLTEVLAGRSSIPVREVGFLVAHGVHNVEVEAQTQRSRSLYYEVCYSTAEVEVDPQTGHIGLRRFISVTDAGKALDRAACEGQDLGAAMMGIGSVLSEELVYEDGVLLNPNLIEYSVPTTEFLPSQGFESILIENGDGPGPFGSKGLGEAGIIAVAPAIANAVYRATGVRIRELPLSPAKVWECLVAAATDHTDQVDHTDHAAAELRT